MSRADEGSWSRHVFVPLTSARDGLGDSVPAERLPDAVARAVRPVVVDLQNAKAPPISLSYFANSEDTSLGTVVVHVGDDTYGFGVDRTAHAADLIVMVAEGIQEHLSETALAWGEALPVCAGHRHPASPRVEAGIAYWVCPRDGRRLAAIGKIQGVNG